MVKTVVDAYWETVLVCLTEIHGVARDDAALLTSRRRQAIDADADTPSPHIFYHREPFDVASSLAGRDLDRRKHDAAYEAIRSRTGLSDPSLPIESPLVPGDPEAGRGARRSAAPLARGPIRAIGEGIEQPT